MKKKYITPQMELVLFEPKRHIMDTTLPGFSGGDPGVEIRTGWGYSIYGTPDGTVINNNGAPTYVPGNGSGGRQTPLG